MAAPAVAVYNLMACGGEDDRATANSEPLLLSRCCVWPPRVAGHAPRLLSSNALILGRSFANFAAEGMNLAAAGIDEISESGRVIPIHGFLNFW